MIFYQKIKFLRVKIVKSLKYLCLRTYFFYLQKLFLPNKNAILIIVLINLFFGDTYFLKQNVQTSRWTVKLKFT